jgi:phosphate/sulfate permease
LELLFQKKIKEGINSRFDQSFYKNELEKEEDAPVFDMIRASVNLVVASILISFATSLKLPLSTTYVTFMVAMGTSLTDRAWGRESAVYRITGVISVIGGWFLTALSAFTVAFIIALIISWGGIVAVVVLLLFALFIVLRTRRIHKRREIKNEAALEEVNSKNIMEKCTNNVTGILSEVTNVYDKTITGFINEDRKLLKDMTRKVSEINSKTKLLKDKVYTTINKLEEDSIETGPYYVQVLDYLRETAHCLSYISKPIFEYVDNNHTSLISVQTEELNDIKQKVSDFITEIVKQINNKNYAEIDEMIAQQQSLLDNINEYRKMQIKRIKKDETGTKNSMLYLGVFHETKNMLLYSINLLKAYRDFMEFSK